MTLKDLADKIKKANSNIEIVYSRHLGEGNQDEKRFKDYILEVRIYQ